MYIMEEEQWAVRFWVLHLKKQIKNFESRVKDGQDVHSLSSKLGWAEELACSAWWGRVSYNILWWCRGHSQGNQSQTLLSSVRNIIKDNNHKDMVLQFCIVH